MKTISFIIMLLITSVSAQWTDITSPLVNVGNIHSLACSIDKLMFGSDSGICQKDSRATGGNIFMRGIVVSAMASASRELWFFAANIPNGPDGSTFIQYNHYPYTWDTVRTSLIHTECLLYANNNLFAKADYSGHGIFSSGDSGKTWQIVNPSNRWDSVISLYTTIPMPDTGIISPGEIAINDTTIVALNGSALWTYTKGRAWARIPYGVTDSIGFIYSMTLSPDNYLFAVAATKANRGKMTRIFKMKVANTTTAVVDHVSARPVGHAVSINTDMFDISGRRVEREVVGVMCTGLSKRVVLR